jgi:hypothetical protein
MNGDVPLLSLDPSADGVSYASVLHEARFGPKSEGEQDEARRIGEHRQAARVATMSDELLQFIIVVALELTHPQTNCARLLQQASSWTPAPMQGSVGRV